MKLIRISFQSIVFNPPLIPQVINNLEADAKNLLWWIKYNGLKANPDKFHLLLSETDQNITMNVDGFDISNSQKEKLLGVIVDNKLTFKAQVTELCNFASQKLHALSRNSNYTIFEKRKTIMNSFIIGQFGHCPLVWINRIH